MQLGIYFEWGNPVFVFIPTITHVPFDDPQFEGFCIALEWLGSSLNFDFVWEKK